jgi:peptidoglycan/LPS O-acetylase OafA/YrhL
LFNSKGRFLFLDGLRAVAAVAVMLFHFFNHWVSPIHDSLATMLPRGIQLVLEHADLGVEVFFVLSGFVIAHSLFEKTITPRYAGSFILRRSLRLDPPYWVVIAGSVVLPYLLFPKWSQNLFAEIGGTTGVLINMFYLPDLLWQPRIVGVAWTLCLEVQFYLAFLLLLAASQGVKFLLHGRYERTATAIQGTIFAALLAYSVHRWFGLGRNDFGGRWFMFFTGVLAYWTLRKRVDRRIFVGYLAVIVGLSVDLREPRAATMLVTAMVIYASAVSGGLQTWLAGRVIQYLGRISYSLYLVHMTAGVATIRLVMQFSNGSHGAAIVALGAAVAMSILLADALNRFVESPAMRLSKCFRATAGDRITHDSGVGWSRFDPVLVSSSNDFATLISH